MDLIKESFSSVWLVNEYCIRNYANHNKKQSCTESELSCKI